MSATGESLLAWLREYEPDLRAMLERLALAESPSRSPDAQRAPFAILAGALEELGFRVRALPGIEVGAHLFALPARREPHRPYQLLVGHMDTVWPLGTTREMPVRSADGRLYGPGVYDMKAGLVQLVFALRALAAAGLIPSVTPVVFVNTDEEIGSRESSRYVRLLARAAARAFVLEPAFGPMGALKTGRKAAGRFIVTVRGRAAHAGTSPEQGVSAILELSHQVQRLFALNDPERGITVNVGSIDGGLAPNVVAPEASAVVDARAVTAADMRELEAAIRGLRPVLTDGSVEVEGGFVRPPMEQTPLNRALYRTARAAAEQLGLSVDEAPVVGGGSDANFTALYTATLDGLGPVGDGAHASDEHVVVSRLVERAALLALLLLEPA